MILQDGGSDCHGTCWFNAKNKGEAGYEHAKDLEEDFCEIRHVPIEIPFWTYCANHPYRCPDRDPIPIGPIYVDRGTGRKLWQRSPDTESIRAHLLELLENIQKEPRPEYSSGFYRDEVVVWQLGEFQEKRALDKLKRIAQFNLEASSGEPINRTRETLVDAAHEAVAKILGSMSNGAKRLTGGDRGCGAISNRRSGSARQVTAARVSTPAPQLEAVSCFTYNYL